MNKSKAPLALMEMAVMVLVFALAAAVCLQAFSYCGLSSRDMEEMDEALSVGSSVADAVRLGDGRMLGVYGLTWEPGTGVSVSPVRDGRRAEDMGLSVAVTYSREGEYLYTGSVIVYGSDGRTLLSLPVAWQEGGGFDG